jgi:hypothetical protein
MSAAGVPNVQIRERSGWDAEPRMTFLQFDKRGALPPRDGHCHPGLRLKEMGDRDKIHGESSSRTWIDAVRGLFPIGHVYSQTNKHNRRTKSTSAVGTHHILHPGQSFWWTEDER